MSETDTPSVYAEAVDEVIRQLKQELRVESTNTKIVTRAVRAE